MDRQDTPGRAAGVEQLIGSLTAGLAPVQRLRAPGVRAAGWLAVVGVLAAALVYATRTAPPFLDRLHDGRLCAEWLATFATGVAGVWAAFQASIPGSSRRWLWVPLAPLVVWIATSAVGCLHVPGLPVIAGGDLAAEDHTECFVFIVGLSLPLSIALFLFLRRAHPLWPVRVAALGTLGVAGLSTALLQFFHPFEVTFLDLGAHLLALALVVGLGTLASRRALA
jgi:hypothetical protein